MHSQRLERRAPMHRVGYDLIIALQFPHIVFRLPHPFGQFFVPGIRLHDGQLLVAIDQHIVGDQGFGSPSKALNADQRDGVFPQHAAGVHHTQPAAFSAGATCSDLVSASFKNGICGL